MVGRRRGRMARGAGMAGALSLLAAAASAAPEGGRVTAGDATIRQGDKLTTIDQRSDKTIIDWRRFGLNADEAARFNQPGSGSIALNRVSGGDPSVILGNLQANGNVWLVNPNGVLFGPGAKVDVGGLVASTADIADKDFLADSYEFSIPSPVAGASVINQGTITFGEHGLAALVAPHVRNDGVIVGRLGQVAMAGAAGFTLDLQGDGLLLFGTPTQVVDGLVADGALVTNTGRIDVDGGQVLITAAAAESIVSEVINAGGIVEARSFATAPGEIVLDGGDHGVVTVSGTLSTAGAEADAKGGAIDVLGDKLMLTGASLLDASGPAGGGSVHVGGDRHGKGERRRASQTVVASGARINADATRRGNGGEVVVWANDRLVFAGTASARGGPEGGDGGFVETSSSTGNLHISGRVDVGAPKGAPGTWLLDPLHVVIADGGSDVPPIFADDEPQNGTAYVSPAAIAAAGGDVVIEATRTINIAAGFTTPRNVTLNAGVGITVRQPISSSGEIRIATRDIRTTDAGVISADRLVLNSIGFQPGQPAGPEFTSFSANLVTDVRELSIGKAAGGDPLFKSVTVQNSGGLTLQGVSSQGKVDIRTDGPLVIDQPIVAGGIGTTVVLVADSIQNRVGAGAVNPGGGRLIVYLNSPVGSSLGGLAGTQLFGRTFETSPPDSIPGTGNVFVYASAAPVVGPDPKQVQIATRGATAPSDSQSAAKVAELPADLLASPPPKPVTNEDLLFSNDGNRELWN